MLNFWHNSSRALDLRGLFLYSGPQVSHRHGCFSSSLHKSFLWASDIFSLINSQSWVSTFSTSTTSAIFTFCLSRICPRSSFPRFWCGKIDQSQVLWSVASRDAEADTDDKIESLLQKVELRSTLHNMLPQLATSKLLRDKLRVKMVIRATTLFNLHRNNVARQVVRKCCPYYLTL